MDMNVVCKKIGIVVGMLAAVTARAATWIGDGQSHLTVTNAVDFYTASNWKDSTPPGTSADLYATPAKTFMKSDRRMETGSLTTFNSSYAGAHEVYILSDNGLYGTCAADNNCLWISPVVYANVEYAGRLVTWVATLCGDFTTCAPEHGQGQLTLAAELFSHRLDRYANDSTGFRENPMSIDKLFMGSSSFYVFAPQSSATNVTGRWNQTEGSPYLFPASGTKHVLSTGTLASGDGISVGTFLRRVFPDGSIELSAPIETGKTKLANDVTFAAFSSVVRQTVTNFVYGGSERRELRLNKFRAEDDFTYTIRNLAGSSGTFAIGTETGWTPAALTISDTSDFWSATELGDCDITFDAGGIPNAKTLTVKGAAKVTVPSGTAVLGVKVTSVTGSLEKRGVGTLALSLTNDGVNTGLFAVREGTLAVTPYQGAQVARVAIANGATLKIASGVLEVADLSVEAGATVEGPGSLKVPTGTDLTGLRFAGGAVLEPVGQSVITWALPATNVVGTPAIWVDATRKETMTLSTEGDVTYLTRLEDVRGSQHFFATNSTAAFRPVYKAKALAEEMPYIQVTGGRANPTREVTNVCALVWDRSIAGIKAVFMVQYMPETGVYGDVLGSTRRVRNSYGDFARPGGQIYTGPMVWSFGPCADVINGRCYQDGVACRPSDGYRQVRNVNSWKDIKGGPLPTVTELHPLGAGGTADCWGYDTGTDAMGQLICECIVYTNALTETERLQVAGYLMKKWCHEEIAWTSTGTGAASGLTTAEGSSAILNVSADNAMALTAVTGSGTLTKNGAGTLDVGGYACAGGTLVVNGGTVTLRSGPRDLPGGAYMRVDAERPNTITYAEQPNGDLRVSAWSDVESAASGLSLKVWSNQTNYPTYRAEAAIGNRHVVDLGRFIDSNAAFGSYGDITARKSSSALQLYKGSASTEVNGKLRTGFWMLGSARGGGMLLGSGGKGFNDAAVGIPRSGGNNTAQLVRSDFGQSDLRDSGKTTFRVNGVETSATAANALSGAYDVISLSSISPVGFNSIGANHYHWWAGGLALGELALYETKLADATVAEANAYLQRKWFGTVSVDYPSACAKGVTVAAGATLRLNGSEPLTTGAIAGGGTVVGDVVLTERATVDLADGNMGGLTVSGTLDMSAGGTVNVTGDMRKIALGRYAVVSATNLKGGAWTATCGKDRTVKLKQIGNTLYLDVNKPGLAIIFR